ncbi:MAG: DNA-binding protein [Lachnospiraceae bacterium]|nr:DNA-binding protein [Lachnospiraceae bacterium]
MNKNLKYDNLRKVLFDKRIEVKALACALGVDEKTIINKLDGNSRVGFSYDEAYELRKLFFSEYDPDYLFTRAMGDDQTDKAS